VLVHVERLRRVSVAVEDHPQVVAGFHQLGFVSDGTPELDCLLEPTLCRGGPPSVRVENPRASAAPGR
jgi:hypothetical protein